MAREPSRSYKVKDIAEGIQAAPGYLVKVMQELAKAGILSARRGSQGGYQLIRQPEGLTALEIVQAIDPIERIMHCPLKLAAHGSQLCPLHRRIDNALALIEESFRKTTIADLFQDPAALTSERIAPLCNGGCESVPASKNHEEVPS
jgi:Rrf2 family protein